MQVEQEEADFRFLIVRSLHHSEIKKANMSDDYHQRR